MANKHIERCLASLVIREMQIKIAGRYHFIPTWMARIKYTIPSVDKEVDLFGELSPNKFCS